MTGNVNACIQWLLNQGRECLFDIEPHRERRSKNANAYCWALINKLAGVGKVSKEECYLMMLKRYGQSEMVSVVSEIDVSGMFKYYDAVAKTELQGKEFTHYRVYKGSSEYNSKEMAELIDGIVQECQNCGIETIPPDELERLKKEWRA